VAGVYNTGDTEAEEHVDSKLNILEFGVVAAGSDGTVPLRAEEERAGEEERSLLATITAEETLVGSALLEGAVGVVDPTVLEDITISGHVGVVLWHAHLLVVLSSAVDGRLVHVVPDAVHVVGTLEDRGVEEILPIVAGRLVEEINPDGLAGTTLTLKSLLGAGVPDEQVRDVVVIDFLALLQKTLLVHEVVVAGADMRISGNNEATARVVDLLVHVHDVVLREALMVILTVVVVLSILAVKPENINGEAEVSEIGVALNNLVSGVLFPLGEVVAERVHRRHGSVTSQLREFLLNLLGVALSAHEVELKSVALRDESVVSLLAVMGVVKEDEGLSGVHPSDGRIGLVRVTSDVRNGSVKRLAVFALIFVLVAVLVEETVRVIKTCLLEAEVVGALGDTVHVRRVDGEVEADRVALDDGASLLGVTGLLRGVLVSSLVVSSNLVVSINEVLVNMLVVYTEVLGIVVKVIVVVDNDGLVAVHILDDSERVELNLVGDLVLAANKDTVIEKLNEILEVLLDLDLIPVDTDTSVGDGEALFLIGSLDLNLHDTLLEESHVEIEVRSTELHIVSAEVLVLVKMEAGVDGVLMDHHAVWLDIVGLHEVVAAEAVCVALLAGVLLVVATELAVVPSEHVAEARAVGLLAAGCAELASPFVVAVVAVRHVLAHVRLVVMIKCVVCLVLRLVVVHEMLLVGIMATATMDGSLMLVDRVSVVHRGAVDRGAVDRGAVDRCAVDRCAVDGLVSEVGVMQGSAVVGSFVHVVGMINRSIMRVIVLATIHVGVMDGGSMSRGSMSIVVLATIHVGVMDGGSMSRGSMSIVVLTTKHVGVMDGGSMLRSSMSIIVLATIEGVVENRGLVMDRGDSLVMSLVKDGLKGLPVGLESITSGISLESEHARGKDRSVEMHH
jgi:hypothetical protein